MNIRAIQLYKGDGELIAGRALILNTPWEIFAKEIINGQLFYRISDTEWIKASECDESSKKEISTHVKTLKTKNEIGNLFTIEGRVLHGQVIVPNSSVDVIREMVLDGQKFYQLDQSDDWIQASLIAEAETPAPVVDEEPVLEQVEDSDMQDTDKKLITTKPGDNTMVYQTDGTRERNRLLSPNVTLPADKMMVINGVKMYRVTDDTWVSSEDIVDK